MAKTLRVISLDFDGCLSNDHFIRSSERDIIASNTALFNHLHRTELGKPILFVGSNRQSYFDDFTNAGKLVEISSSDYKAGSCYPYFKKIAKALSADFDKMLLADIYNDLKHGTAIKQAKTVAYTKASEPGQKSWLFDKNKMTILYAQMHKVASKHPNQNIVFDFYDDKSEILDSLHQFFMSFPYLIPENVTLGLHRYTGDAEITSYAPIKGTGEADKNYANTIKLMASCSLEQDKSIGFKTLAQAQESDFNGEIDSAKHYIPGMISEEAEAQGWDKGKEKPKGWAKKLKGSIKSPSSSRVRSSRSEFSTRDEGSTLLAAGRTVSSPTLAADGPSWRPVNPRSTPLSESKRFFPQQRGRDSAPETPPDMVAADKTHDLH